MDEFLFIDKIKQFTYKQSSLIKGVGDDGAVFHQSTQDTVTAVDTFVENVHFSRNTMSAVNIGYRALGANLSDLAAMGATPAFYLVSVVIPKSWSEEEVLDVFSGMKQLANQFKMDLIGGDTVSGTELCISITVIGYVPKDKARFRHTACNGDVVFVTGTLGDSQAGLHILTNEGTYINGAYYINKHQKPHPKVFFSQRLENISRVTLNDISDGIANEASEIAVASRQNLILFDNKLPVSRSFNQFPVSSQHEWKYFGGEDYELLGTVSKKNWNKVQEIAKRTATEVTKIGYVEYNDKKGQVMVNKEGHLHPLDQKGYTHFKSR